MLLKENPLTDFYRTILIFSKDVTLSIPYDISLIPPGGSEKDIATYYYNLEQKNKIVTKDSVDQIQKLIFSKTNHFTDYINGIIVQPESPETASFTPTAMNDIKQLIPFLD